MTVIKTKKETVTTPPREEKFVLICLDGCGDMCKDRYSSHSFNTEAEAIAHMQEEDTEESPQCIVCKIISEYEAATKYKEIRRYG